MKKECSTAESFQNIFTEPSQPFDENKPGPSLPTLRFVAPSGEILAVVQAPLPDLSFEVPHSDTQTQLPEPAVVHQGTSKCGDWLTGDQ